MINIIDTKWIVGPSAWTVRTAVACGILAAAAPFVPRVAEFYCQRRETIQEQTRAAILLTTNRNDGSSEGLKSLSQDGLRGFVAAEIVNDRVDALKERLSVLPKDDIYRRQIENEVAAYNLRHLNKVVNEIDTNGDSLMTKVEVIKYEASVANKDGNPSLSFTEVGELRDAAKILRDNGFPDQAKQIEESLTLK